MRTIIKYTIFLTAFVSSCGTSFEGPSEITPEIEGSYLFKYPTGQIEVFGIKKDYTFSQAIYANQDDYANRKPLYKNGGDWTFKHTSLTFDHWLVYCQHRNPNIILDTPKVTSVLNISWYEKTNKHKALIDFFSENGYVFEKIEQ